jgi:hypothetical protein
MLRARRTAMKRALALTAIVIVLFAMLVPSPASAGGWGHHGGHRGHHGGWWWPGALIGGLALGAVALATAPLWAFTPPTPVVEAPPAAYVQPVYTAAPSYQPAPTYATSQPPAFQREVVYANGRYLLFGDGVRHPWQWVWVPAATPPPPPPPPR